MESGEADDRYSNDQETENSTPVRTRSGHVVQPPEHYGHR